VEKNLLKDCPIVGTDVLAAEDIIGPNVGSLRGETVRREGHVSLEYHQVPSRVMAKYHEVALCTDMMFINKLRFLVTISRDIKFGWDSRGYKKSKAQGASGHDQIHEMDLCFAKVPNNEQTRG
jgi:hypothetical protein